MPTEDYRGAVLDVFVQISVIVTEIDSGQVVLGAL